MKARDLAALAALGAVGYHLSKGKGKKDDKIDASAEEDMDKGSGRRDAGGETEDVDRRAGVPERKGVGTAGVDKRSDADDFKGVRQPTRPGQDKSGSRSVAPKTVAKKPDVADKPAAKKPDVADKPAAEKAPVEDYGNEGRRASSMGDKIAAINAKSGAASPSARQVDALRAASRKAAAEDTAKRRTSGTLPQIQAPGTQSMARYPGGLAKRGANVSVPEDKPITRILGTDQDYVDAITATAPVGLAAKLAAKMAYKKDAPLKYYDQPALGGPSTPLLGAPAKQLTGPSKTDLMARDRASRASERQDAMTRENADRYGLNPNAPGYDAAASSLRDRLGGRDFTLKKKGGVIKKMASGGMTSRSTSASSRGDGIAQRGKTRGSMR